MSRFWLFFFFLVLFFGVPGSVNATNRFSLVSFNPVFDGGNLFTVRESSSLNYQQWNAGTAFEYNHKPLQANFGTSNVRLVQRNFTQHFFGTMGLTDWLSFSLDLPIIWYSSFRHPDTLAAATKELGLGDLQTELKLKFLDKKTKPLGLAFAPFLTIPTGREAIFAGEDGVTGGGRMIVDTKIGKRAVVSFNASALFRKKFDAYGLNVGHQFLASAGAAYRAFDFLSLVGEVETRSPFSQFFKENKTSPVEIKTGLQWQLSPSSPFTINTGAGFGVNHGSYLPQYRGFASLVFIHPAKDVRKKSKIITPSPVFLFDFDSIKGKEAKQGTLQQVVQAFHVAPQGSLLCIEGFTDNAGNSTYNETLGQRRAKVIKKRLARMGIDPSLILVSSYGANNPTTSNKTFLDRSQNRRVEIKIVFPKTKLQKKQLKKSSKTAR